MKLYGYLTLQEKPYIEFSKIYHRISLATGLRDLPKDFYNLPFTPELITKFFKGWELVSNSDASILFLNEEYDYSIVHHIPTGSLLISKRENDYNIIKTLYPKPLVLNDFIRDCIRCKIKLEI